MISNSVQAKKILLVGSSWHFSRTKSMDFLLNYLKQFFTVDVVLDKGWLGVPEPDHVLDFVTDDYSAILFFQVFPSKADFAKIKHRNVVLIPMYDDCSEDYVWWLNYKEAKILNFCKKLHNLFTSWGFQSSYVQNFPEPQVFTPGNPAEIFFWQRKPNLTYHKVFKLLPEHKIKLHIHKIMDKQVKFDPPSKADEATYKVTYSDWFERKEQLVEVMQAKGIFISPRAQEGIGFSFLEAMAMGKAVVAVNDATMNEYITDQKNGYLFDLNNPKAIDLSQVQQIQKNAHEYMRNGYAQWLRERSLIIDLINSDLRPGRLRLTILVVAVMRKIFKVLISRIILKKG